MFTKVCSFIFIRIRTISCLVIAVLAIYTNTVYAVPITINFTGEVTSLSVDSINPPFHYDLSTLPAPLGNSFVGTVFYNMDPNDPNYIINHYVEDSYVNIIFSSGTAIGRSGSVIKESNGMLTVIPVMDSQITNNPALTNILCDPDPILNFDGNTMKGDMKIWFTDLVDGLLTGQIDNFTQSSQPVPEPSTIILLIAGLAGVGWIQLKRMTSQNGGMLK